MPVLPASGYNTPQAPNIEALPAAPGGTQDIRASADAFGGLTGDALSRFGQSLEKTAGSFENIHKFYQETAAADQSLKTQIEVNKLMYGDPDKPGDRGFIGLEGENAMREMPERRKQIESIISTARGNLGTQYAVGHFDNEIQRFRNYILTDMGRKYDQEMTKWRDETDKGLKTMSAADSSRAANSGDMARFKESLVNDEMVVRKAGAAKGLPQEAIDAEVGTRRTALAKEKAESLLASDPLQGRAFIQANGDILTTHQPDLLARANAAVTKQMQDDIIAGKDVSRYSETLPGPMVRGGAVQSRISQEASKAGLDPATILAFADIESGMGSNLGRRGNIFQLGQTEWAAAGGGPMGNTDTDIKNGLSDIKKREADLTVALGRKPEGWELYLAHQQGVGGAISLLTNPNTSAGNLVRDPSYISGNGGDPNAPASQFVAKTRALFENRKARYSGGGTPAAPATTAGGEAPAPAVRPVTAIGDSLGQHLVNSGGAQGKGDRTKIGNYRPGDTTVNGFDPQQILDTVIPGLPDELVKGKDVTFSTGISNATNAKEAQYFLKEVIPAQIAALRERGAKNIVLMGVGPAAKLVGVNDALAQIAEQNKDAGVTFAGPQRAPNPGDPDKLHSRDQKAEMDAVQEALAKTPTTPATTPTPPAPGTASGGPAPAPGANYGSPQLQELMRNAPERDPGQPADTEVPGLVQALERDAQRLPKNLPPQVASQVWQGIVQKERRIFNASQVDQQRALQERKRADEEADHQLMQQFRLRLGTADPPTVAEVNAAPFRDEKNAHTMAGFIRRELQPEPAAHVAKATTADLYRRMDDKAEDKLTNMDPVHQAFVDTKIGKDDLKFLEERWKDKTDAKASDIHARTERIWKSLVQRQLRPHASMGATFESFMDIQAQDDGQMTSGEREMGWREKVAEALKDAKDKPDGMRKLFDRKEGNSEYIGSPEFMAEFMPDKTLPGPSKGGPDVKTIEGVRRSYKLDDPVQVEKAKAAVKSAFDSGLYGPRTSAEAREKAGAILRELGFRHEVVQPPVPMAR